MKSTREHEVVCRVKRKAVLNHRILRVSRRKRANGREGMIREVVGEIKKSRKGKIYPKLTSLLPSDLLPATLMNLIQSEARRQRSQLVDSVTEFLRTCRRRRIRSDLKGQMMYTEHIPSDQ